MLWWEMKNPYYLAMRDVGKKVYVIPRGSHKPRLLYDFGLKVGETVRCGIEGNSFGCLLDKEEEPDTLLGFPFLAYLKVERIDTIKIYGLDRRVFTLSLLDAFMEHFVNELEPIQVFWVEGIGSKSGPFSPWLTLPQRCIILRCDVKKTGTNDSEGINNIQYHPTSSMMYNLYGHRLTDMSHNELYIRGGKKYIAK